MDSFRQKSQALFNSDQDFNWLTLVKGENYISYNYSQLESRINDYCHFYAHKNLKEGDSVLIILKESLDLFASFYAAINLGIIPAYYAYPSPKQTVESFVISMQNLLNYNEISLVITFEEVEIVLRDQKDEFAKNLQTVDFTKINRVDGENQFQFLEITQEAFLQFSSGTTAAKKGVLIDIPSLFNQIEAYAPSLEFNEDSRIISWLPHYHDMGLIACMFLPFIQKIPIIMMSPFEWVKNPGILLKSIEEQQGTHIWLPNFALGHICKTHSENELRSYNLHSLKRIVLCSEPVLYETLSDFKQKMNWDSDSTIRIDNCYAMAENTYAMTQTGPNGINFIEIDENSFQKEHKIVLQTSGKKIASAGYPLPNIQIVINDTHGNALPEDVVGEVLIKSNCMLRGYYKNEKATEEAFVNGFFNTGDLGFFHDGQLYITGRKKELIIVGGENIYPQDIELILNKEEKLVPGRNVVFGVDDDRIGTEKIVILAELKNQHDIPDITLLSSKILNSLNISVREIHFLPHMSLKKGTAGKISRFLNKNAFLSGELNNLSAAKDVNQQDIVREVVLASLPKNLISEIDNHTSLMKSGLIDSFGFTYLVQSLEEKLGFKFSTEYLRNENFETLDAIKNTIKKASGHDLNEPQSPDLIEQRESSLERLKKSRSQSKQPSGFLEFLINKLPFKGNFWYSFLLRQMGVQVGKDVQFLGKINIKIRGKASNIVIGDQVILGDGVDLRNRENGKIILHTKVYLDSAVRLVAAREGKIEIGYGSEVGGNTIINSGGLTQIGQYVLIAGNCNINSSSHGISRESFIKEQAHTHGMIQIENDVWIGAGASILMNTFIGEGSVISGNSLVSGKVDPFSIMSGVPAKLIKMR
jgi:acyl-CoA synthetase (AMP-forming)/AMP-acid ligase II/acetyltransferase-like isoleucine patch superfamily enzyme